MSQWSTTASLVVLFSNLFCFQTNRGKGLCYVSRFLCLYSRPSLFTSLSLSLSPPPSFPPPPPPPPPPPSLTYTDIITGKRPPAYLVYSTGKGDYPTAGGIAGRIRGITTVFFMAVLLGKPVSVVRTKCRYLVHDVMFEY